MFSWLNSHTWLGISSPALEPSLGPSECRPSVHVIGVGRQGSWSGGLTKRCLVSAAFSGTWHLPCRDQSLLFHSDYCWCCFFSFLLFHASGTDIPLSPLTFTLLLPSHAQCMLLLTHLIWFCLEISIESFFIWCTDTTPVLYIFISEIEFLMLKCFFTLKLLCE